MKTPVNKSPHHIIKRCNAIIQGLIPFMALIFCLTSCMDSRSDKTDRSGYCFDLTQVPESLSYDSIIELPLKLPEDEIIGEFSKILHCKDNFFILDNKQNRIWSFDKSGNCLDILCSIGTGPGEYARIADFDIDNDYLYLLDVIGRKILCFSSETMSFIKSNQTRQPGLCFAVGDSSHFYFENPINNQDNVKLSLWNSADGVNNPILKYKIEDESRARGKGRTHFWRSGQKILYYSRFSPTIYILSDTGITDSIDIVSRHFPTSEQIQHMINESKMDSPRTSRNDSPVIRDIRDVYITPQWTSVNVYSTPSELLFIDNSTGRPGKVEFDERFADCRKSAMGVCGEYFITVKENNQNQSLILYTLCQTEKESMK